MVVVANAILLLVVLVDKLVVLGLLESLLLVDVFLTELAVVADDFKVELMALDLMLELELDLLLLVDAFLTGVDLITYRRRF